MPDGLLRLDERPPHVVIADQSELQRYSRLLGKAHGRRHPGVWHRGHKIRVHSAFARQLPTESFTNLINAVTVEIAVGTRKVNILEDTFSLRYGGKGLERLDSIGTKRDDLAGLHLALIGGLDQVQRASFRGDNVGAFVRSRVKPSEDQWTKTHGIPCCNHPIWSQKQQRIGAACPAQRLDDTTHESRLFRCRNQMNDDFGIGGGLKDGPRVFQLFAQYFSVDQIAVMRDCDWPLRVFDDKRLNIFQMTLAGR